MYQPSDFKIPFSFEDRKPLLQNSFLFIPTFFETKGAHGPVLDLFSIFSNNNPIQIEFCSGNGSWIANKAENSPLFNWIAVEKDFHRARKIWLRAKRQNLKNLFLIFGEALTFVKYYLPDGSIKNIFVNFPDPWPKRKHYKKRLVSIEFMQEVKKKIQPQGKATFVTDHKEMAQFMIKSALKSKFKPVFKKPYFQTSLKHYGTSYFEELFRERGRLIYYMQFQTK